MTDIKISFLVSFVLHSLFFLSLSLLTVKPQKIYYIPIQIIGVNTSGAITKIGNEKNISKIAAKELAAERDKIKQGDIVAVKSVKNIKKKDKETAAEKSQKKFAQNNSEESKASNPAAGSGSGSGIGVSVDSGNFPYVGYINILRNKVAENWTPAPYAYSGIKKVLIYFSISKNGSVDKLTVKETSGVSYIDRSAIRSVKNSSPFPPLPSGFPDEYLGVYFMFELSGG